MKDTIKTYIFLGDIVGTAVFNYNAVSTTLDKIYEPDVHFSKEKAERIKVGHKVVASVVTLNNVATVTNVLGRIMYKSK